MNDQRKEYLRQLEAAQRELAALRGQAAPTAAADVAAPEAQPTVDEDALEEEYAEALLDSDSMRAAAIRRQIKDHQAVVTIQQYEALQHQRASSQLDAQTINSILDEHKWLDTNAGAEALDVDADQRRQLEERLVLQLRMISKGAYYWYRREQEKVALAQISAE